MGCPAVHGDEISSNLSDEFRPKRVRLRHDHNQTCAVADPSPQSAHGHPLNPWTLSAATNLAATQGGQGKHTEAEELQLEKSSHVFASEGGSSWAGSTATSAWSSSTCWVAPGLTTSCVTTSTTSAASPPGYSLWHLGFIRIADP